MNPFRLLARLWSELEGLLIEFESILPFQFFRSWFGSRDYLDLLRGIPAIVASLLLVLGVLAARQQEEYVKIKQSSSVDKSSDQNEAL